MPLGWQRTRGCPPDECSWSALGGGKKEDRVGGEVWGGVWAWEMVGLSRCQMSSLLLGMLCLMGVSLFHVGAGKHIP